MARDTKERLLAAGERLFAREGVHRVKVKDLNELAGQRNASALHYHFGSRDGLLQAIVDRHTEVVDTDRAGRLDALGPDPTLHELVEVVLAPLAERLRSPSGRDYLRIVPQLLDLATVSPPALAQTMKRVGEHLGHLPEPVRRERQRAMLLATFTLLADRAARPKPALPHDEFVANLVDMATGMLQG